MGKRKISDKGFSLIEMIVAIAILGIGLMIIIELFSGGLRIGRVSDEYTKALHYGRIKMEEIRINPPIEEGRKEGKFNESIRWQMDIKEVDILQVEKSQNFKPPAKLFKIDLVIFWSSGLKERYIKLESYQTIGIKEIEEKS